MGRVRGGVGVVRKCWENEGKVTGEVSVGEGEERSKVSEESVERRVR